MKKWMRSLIKKEDGASAIEFAIVAPLFLLIIMGIMEFSILLYQRSAIEGAMQQALRIGQLRFSDEAIIDKPVTDEDGKIIADSNANLYNTALTKILNKTIEDTMIGGYKPENLTVASKIFNTINDNIGALDCSTDSSNAYGSNKRLCYGESNSTALVEMTATYKHEFVTPLALLANGMDDSLEITATGFMKTEPTAPTHIDGI